ncbi:MAG: polyprenyl synthetase family protein [Candidatus Eremiobacteraeota bacterium]|nr:polyprenyl synthetase family protein [Candidatus Eremiobacteraeota bacterium]
MLLYHFGYGVDGAARRGKRLRPRLLLEIVNALGGETDSALNAAAAIELLHNYSLIHDDIEDRDELRHGRATLWTKYGLAQAVNAGDALCAMTFLTLLDCADHHDGDRVVAMVRALHSAHLVMCDGQSLDIAFESATQVDPSQYFKMIGAKTASLFGAACELGALCANADETSIANARELGHHFGLAFQMLDDVRGIWADSETTGKATGVDIARRKWTYPVVWALSGPTSALRDRIAKTYSSPSSPSVDDVADVVEALDSLGARAAANAAITEHLDFVERYPLGGVRNFLLGSLTLAAH